jgi:hypothetical protein
VRCACGACRKACGTACRSACRTACRTRAMLAGELVWACRTSCICLQGPVDCTMFPVTARGLAGARWASATRIRR